MAPQPHSAPVVKTDDRRRFHPWSSHVNTSASPRPTCPLCLTMAMAMFNPIRMPSTLLILILTGYHIVSTRAEVPL